MLERKMSEQGRYADGPHMTLFIERHVVVLENYLWSQKWIWNVTNFHLYHSHLPSKVTNRDFYITLNPLLTYCVQYILSKVYIVYSKYCVQYILCTVYIVYNIYCVQYILCTVFIVYSIYCVQYILFAVYIV